LKKPKWVDLAKRFEAGCFVDPSLKRACEDAPLAEQEREEEETAGPQSRASTARKLLKEYRMLRIGGIAVRDVKKRTGNFFRQVVFVKNF